MSAIAPDWALSAQAIDGTGSPHLQPGVHYRINTHPCLGLPLFPLAVYRLNLGPSGKAVSQSFMRTDVRWIDSHGAVLTPPFALTPDNPVRGYLPVGLNARVGWVRVMAKPKTQVANPALINPALIDALGNRPLAAPTNLLAVNLRINSLTGSALPVDSPANRVDARLRESLADRLRERLLNTRTSRLEVSVFRQGYPHGFDILATRSSSPYDFGASDLNGVLVEGEGTVEGLIWLDWSRFKLDRQSPWRLLPLPVSDGPRYTGIPDGIKMAHERVRRGAPRRLGLHDAPSSANAGACPTATEDDELARLEVLGPRAEQLLKRLVQDTDRRPRELMTEQQIAVTPDEQDPRPTFATYPVLATHHMGALDPTIGRFVGLLDRDEEPQGNPGDVIVYLIRGFFAVDFHGLNFAALGGVANAYQNGGAITSPTVSGLPFRVHQVSVDSLPVLDLFVPAVTTLGVPPDVPRTPALGAPLPVTHDETPLLPGDTPEAGGGWVAEVRPPDAARDVRLPVTNLLSGAGLAFARDQGSTPLNRFFSVPSGKRAQSLLPSSPTDSHGSGQGRVEDHRCPPDATNYRVAQHDWFGRWSSWGTVSVPAKDRVPPPPPVVQGLYTMAVVPAPVPAGPLWGKLEAVIRPPKLSGLTPGSRALASLQITGSIQLPGGPTISLTHPPTTAPLTNPDRDTPDPLLHVELTPSNGTLLPRHGKATAQFSAVWVDTAGVHSEASNLVKVECVDPRPPAPIEMDSTLRYAARPDADGRARAAISWPVTAGQHRFRVYYSDEVRVTNRLRLVAQGQPPIPPVDDLDTPWQPNAEDRTVAQTLLEDLEAASHDAPARALVFVRPQARHLFRKGFFQQVTKKPVTANGSAQLTLQHDLSGSLRAIAFYRIVPVSEQEVEGSWADAPLLPFAVPSFGGPTQPFLEKVSPPAGLAPESARGRMHFRVRVLRGTQPVVAYRLRRASLSAKNPGRMAVVRIASVSPSQDGNGPIEFDIEDGGPTQADPNAGLRPFLQYSWRVEVQSPDLPGAASLAGEWSRPSEPVAAMLLPEPPLPPQVDGVSLDETDPDHPVATIAFSYPDPDPSNPFIANLDGGSLGSYRFDVYRQLGSGMQKRVASISAEVLRRSYTVIDKDFSEAEQAEQAQYRIVLIDPSGRMSPPSPFVGAS